MVQREPRQQRVVDAVGPSKALDIPQVVVDLTETSEPQLQVDLRLDPQQAARDLHVARSYERFVKPGIDRILAIVIYLLLVPLLLVLIVAIWGTMGRPAIFRQQRVGKDGQPFTMYKLRTMRTDRRVEQIPFDGPDRRRVHKTPGDPRITGTGRLLRKWSLDEIPQLMNVALGHMSLVGPRPELVEIVDTKYEPWQHQRHAVKPGLTGLWQISEQRQELMYQATEIDLEYLDRISLREDLRILALTIPAALGKRSSF
ncbi:MAG: sugar transferase [Acidobacteria bacterium]|nr:sugar transferase [Acidobacteriota bacterium]